MRMRAPTSSSCADDTRAPVTVQRSTTGGAVRTGGNRPARCPSSNAGSWVSRGDCADDAFDDGVRVATELVSPRGVPIRRVSMPTLSTSAPPKSAGVQSRHYRDLTDAHVLQPPQLALPATTWLRPSVSVFPTRTACARLGCTSSGRPTFTVATSKALPGPGHRPATVGSLCADRSHARDI